MSPRPAIAGLLLLAASAGPGPAAEPLVHQPHCQQGLFCIEAERRDDRIDLWLAVQAADPLIVVVLPEADGLAGDPGPLRRLTKGAERVRLQRFQIERPGAWRLDWTYSFHPAGPPARHAPRGPYRLPYAPGQAYRVIQAGGGWSHSGPLAHAIDWAMPLGSEVRAARGGEVIGLRGDQPAGGPDPALRGRENFVWIRHADGTVGQYLHLQADSLLVGPGESVAAGQPIARSGHSGHSSEPHLHFHVASPREAGPWAFESLPLTFDLGGGRQEPLEAGRRYAAPPAD